MSDSETRPPARRRSIVIAAVVVALVFAAGVLAGIIGDRIYLVTHERIVPRGGIALLGKHLMRHLDRSLDLSAAQEEQVKAIVEKRAERLLELESTVHSTIHDEFAATHAEIATILTPAQREKFEGMQKRWHGRRHIW